MSDRRYVLITAARNEEQYIRFAAESVIAQSVRPVRWIVVSDGSTDETDSIVNEYAARHDFVGLVRRGGGTGRFDFVSKVHALAEGYRCIKETEYDFIGHLDADVSFEPDYYERVLTKFDVNPGLGLAGGFIYERYKKDFVSRPVNTSRSVAGAIQLFRRECYEAIGDIVPFTVGGEDAYAEVMARMKGWEVEAFPELRVLHHRRSVAARGVLRESFQYGVMDYALGNHPLFETLKGISRLKERPIAVATFLRMCGFAWSYCCRQRRPVSDEFVDYVRREQIDLLKARLRMPGSGSHNGRTGVTGS